MHKCLLLIASLTAAPLFRRDNPTFYFPSPTVTKAPLSKKISSDPVDTEIQIQNAVSYMMSTMDITDRSSFQRTDVHVLSSGAIAYKCTEMVNGLSVANTAVTVTVSKRGVPMSLAVTWANTNTLAKRAEDPEKEISAAEALVHFATSQGFTEDISSLITKPGKKEGETIISGAAFNREKDVIASLKYYQTATSMEKVFDLKVPFSVEKYHNAFISVYTGNLIGLTNMATPFFYDPSSIATKIKPSRWRTVWRVGLQQGEAIGQPVEGAKFTGDFKYNVVNFPAMDFSEGRQVIVNPANLITSCNGWHSISGKGTFSQTAGNNVIAQENGAGNGGVASIDTGARPEQADFNFDFSIDDQNQEPSEYRKASVTNTFVITNQIHDLMYTFGFDENAGNFQFSNFNENGQARDGIIADVQDISGMNNANFATPDDGQPGQMNIFLFNKTAGPQRDGGLDNGVIAHELMHGVSTRLTGGPSRSNCLSSDQAGGLGEGWGDFLVSVLTMKADQVTANTVIAAYFTRNARSGIRRFPISTDIAVNPLSYQFLQETNQVHAVGEVWSVALFEVLLNLVAKHGFTADLQNPQDAGKGNAVMMQLVLDGMKLQPCNPSFLQARNAIVDADIARGGENGCDIMRGFAKRGMGVGAIDDGEFINNHDLSSECLDLELDVGATRVVDQFQKKQRDEVLLEVEKLLNNNL